MLSPAVRRRLEIQGFTGLDDASLAEAGPWLRLTPAFCTAIIIVATVFALPELLWALVPFALLGAAFPRHPFDYIYNVVRRHLTGTRLLPPNGAPRRFACGLAAGWMSATALAFMAGYDTLAYVLGGIIASSGLLVSATHFCIPSLLYRFVTRSGLPQAAYTPRARVKESIR